MPILNRRRLLSTAAAGTTLSLAAPALAGSASERVVVGVMGMSRGKSLAETFAATPNVHVKYVCDADSRRAEAAKFALQQKNVACEAITDFRKILDDREIDALVCAAPNHWHAPATILACNAGKHVYVEKPCSHNAQEGEWMVQSARKHGRLVQMGTQRRSGTKVREAIQRIHEGEIGRAYAARCWYFNRRGSIGAGKAVDPPKELDYELWQGPAPRLPYMSNRVHYNWHWFWHYGNGELGNNGVHALDLCRWGLQTEFPNRVCSTGGRYHFSDDQETPDTHTVGFEFEDRKSIVWSGHSCNRMGDGFVAFYGDKGALTIDGGGGYQLFDINGKVKDQHPGSQGQPEHIANFVAAIRDEGATPLNAEIETGHRTTLLCHLGNISHRTGRALVCNTTNGHIQNDPEAAKLWERDYAPGWRPQA